MREAREPSCAAALTNTVVCRKEWAQLTANDMHFMKVAARPKPPKKKRADGTKKAKFVVRDLPASGGGPISVPLSL